MDKEKEFLKSLKRFTREQKNTRKPQFERIETPKVKYNRKAERLNIQKLIEEEEYDYGY